MFEEILKKFRNRNRTCLTVVRNSNKVLDNHQILKKRNKQIELVKDVPEYKICFVGVKGLNVYERSKASF